MHKHCLSWLTSSLCQTKKKGLELVFIISNYPVWICLSWIQHIFFSNNPLFSQLRSQSYVRLYIDLRSEAGSILKTFVENCKYLQLVWSFYMMKMFLLVNVFSCQYQNPFLSHTFPFLYFACAWDPSWLLQTMQVSFSFTQPLISFVWALICHN